MANPCTSVPVPAACTPSGLSPRVLNCFTRRFNAATKQAKVPIPPQPTNGDNALHDKCGTYTKCVKQASPGKVDLGAYGKFETAISTGQFSDFENVPLGGSRTLNGPMGAYAYNFVGGDTSQFGLPSVPAPPGVASKEYATELVELYWCSLLRDTAFSNYGSSSVAQAAAAELTTLKTWYKGPAGRHEQRGTPGAAVPGRLCRRNHRAVCSRQFLLAPTSFGALPVVQKYNTYAAGVDYMTDEASWYAVQQGQSTGLSDQVDPVPRYLHDGRGLAAWTHVDELFQAYFTGVPWCV